MVLLIREISDGTTLANHEIRKTYMQAEGVAH